MKRPLAFLVMTVLLILAGSSCIRYYGPYETPATPPPPAPSEPSFDAGPGDYDSAYFYNELEPFGIWVTLRPYGYVWIPRDVGYGWRPYTMGYWAWTNYGWTWVSNLRWGWIAFHYGRWGFDRALGWYWVPDTVWAPAWVAWRWGDAHVGWAPLPPGIAYVPGRGFGQTRWDIPGRYWSFVRGRDFMDRHVNRWILPVERNVTIINLTRFEVNIDEHDRHIFDRGVDTRTVERWSGRPVSVYTLKDAGKPGPSRLEGADLIVAKPVIKRNEAARPKRAIDEAAAQRELDAGTGSRVYRQTSGNEEESVRRAHDQERTLMKESQQAEINEVQRKAKEDEAKVRNPVEKRKVQAQASARVAELKKRHDQEKADLEKRQKAEKDKAKTNPVRRRTEPVKH
jgi:hypothetical protein